MDWVDLCRKWPYWSNGNLNDLKLVLLTLIRSRISSSEHDTWTIQTMQLKNALLSYRLVSKSHLVQSLVQCQTYLKRARTRLFQVQFLPERHNAW